MLLWFSRYYKRTLTKRHLCMTHVRYLIDKNSCFWIISHTFFHIHITILKNRKKLHRKAKWLICTASWRADGGRGAPDSITQASQGASTTQIIAAVALEVHDCVRHIPSILYSLQVWIVTRILTLSCNMHQLDKHFSWKRYQLRSIIKKWPFVGEPKSDIDGVFMWSLKHADSESVYASESDLGWSR